MGEGSGANSDPRPLKFGTRLFTAELRLGCAPVFAGAGAGGCGAAVATCSGTFATICWGGGAFAIGALGADDWTGWASALVSIRCGGGGGAAICALVVHGLMGLAGSTGTRGGGGSCSLLIAAVDQDDGG